MADVFLSYASEDRSRVEPIVGHLTSCGYSVWWDRELIAGPSFDQIIERELDAARCVVVAWSEHSVGSHWCRAEANEGLERKILVPLSIDPVRPPLAFRSLQTASLCDWPNDGGEMAMLIAGIDAVLGSSTPPAERAFWTAKQAPVDQISGPVADKRPVAKPTIAILPFANHSDDKEKAYFAEGITEDLVMDLSRGKHLFIKSARREDQETDAMYVVRGSVRSIADRVRINVQLTNASTDETLWAERFDRSAEDLFEMQDEITSSITSALGARVTKAESARANGLQPTVLSAWEAVQRASFYRGAAGNSEEETNRSIDELRRATVDAPEYAYAHSMLAWILNYRAVNMLTDHPEADVAEAVPHLEKGLSLAENDPFNLNICGGALSYVGEYDKAESLCDRALSIDPNYADAYFNLASIYSATNRHDLADEALDRVERLAPNGPMSRYYDYYRSTLRARQGRLEEAAALLRSTIDIAPGYPVPYLLLAVTYAELGMMDEAAEWLIRLKALSPRYLDRCTDPRLVGITQNINIANRRDWGLLAGIWPR
jgi:adenylate cyclase